MTGNAGKSGATVPERPPIRYPAAVGILLILVFCAGFFTWSAMAPLQSAAIAAGSVNLDTYRKTVQHLEGGIVREIRVREGQNVAKDDVLIVLDDTQATAKTKLLEAQSASEGKQLALINEEIADAELLLKKGLARKTRILALHRRRAELEGNRTQHRAELHAARDVIARSRIRAPISGAVVGLKVNTPGGVIQQGAALLSIVPADEPLVVEARIDPNDIDVVHKGSAAQVRLTPFNARMAPPLPGNVVWISADRLSDEVTRNGYYLARVKLATQPASLPEGLELYPGMPVEVIILTGERSLMSYFIAPLSRSFRRAFREQ